MKRLKTITIGAGLLALALTPALSAGGGSGFASFSLAGTVSWVWYPGPWPPPAAVIRVEFGVDDEPRGYDIYCWDDLAAVCASLNFGDRVLVLGKDDGEQKTATHIGMWMEVRVEDPDA